METTNLTAALALAAAGLKIFPAGADKRPMFKKWQEIATTDRDVISDWWRRAPNALPAVPCGPNGLLVIDLDRHVNGSDGVSAFKALVEYHGGLPPGVPMVKTPNKGLHLYFRQPPGESLGNGRGSLPAGCDVRGAGGFVIGPGAVLPDGRGWVHVPERPPVTQAAQLVWIEGILKKPTEPEREDHLAAETSDQRGRAYAERALVEIEADLAITKVGERNERLYKSAFRLGTMAARGWLMESRIAAALLAACENNQYLREHGHRATLKTIESGIRDGLMMPHDDLEDPNNGPAGAGNDLDLHLQQPQQHQKQQQKIESPRRQRTTGEWDDPDEFDPGRSPRRAAGAADRCISAGYAPLDARRCGRRRRHHRSHRIAVDRHRLGPDRRGAPGAGQPLVAAANDLLDVA